MTHSLGKDGRIESSLFHSREWWAQQFRMKVKVWSQEASTSKGRLNLLAIAFLSIPSCRPLGLFWKSLALARRLRLPGLVALAVPIAVLR